MKNLEVIIIAFLLIILGVFILFDSKTMNVKLLDAFCSGNGWTVRFENNSTTTGTFSCNKVKPIQLEISSN